MPNYLFSILQDRIMIFIAISAAIKFLGLVNMLELRILLSSLEMMENQMLVQDVVEK